MSKLHRLQDRNEDGMDLGGMASENLPSDRPEVLGSSKAGMPSPRGDYKRKFELAVTVRKPPHKPSAKLLKEHKRAQRPLGIARLSAKEREDIKNRVLQQLHWRVQY